MVRWVAGGGLTGALLLVPVTRSSALAEAPPADDAVRLEYQLVPGAEGCPDEDAFRKAVTAQIPSGADPFSAGAQRVLRVTFAPLKPEPGYQATMELLDTSGRSAGSDTKEAPTCAAAARALALSASVLFLAPPVPHAEPPSAPRDAPTAPHAPKAPDTPLHPPALLRVELGAGALLGLGFAPNPSAGFGGFVGVRFPRFGRYVGVVLEGRADLDASGSLVQLRDGTARARTAFVGGSVAACLYLAHLFLCPLLTLGAVRGSAGEVYQPAEQVAVFAGLGGRAGVELFLVDGPPAFGVRVSADGLFNVSQPQLYAGGELLWQAEIGAGALSAQVVTLF